MFVQSHLSRIKYAQIPDVSLETLKALHYQHQLHISIENLDTHIGTTIRLDLKAIFAYLPCNPGNYRILRQCV
jgi:N-hydroxyarylamine O-acetyltransferase